MADLRTHRELTERGEAAIVSALLGLGPDYVILPHLLLSGMLGTRNPDDLDVVVLGPGGAALIEYRHWHGQLQIKPEGEPWVLQYAAGGSESRPNPFESLKRKSEALREHLADHHVVPPTFVTAVVVPDRTRLEGTGEMAVLHASKVAHWLEERLSGPHADWTLTAADLLRPPSPPRMVNQYRLTSLLGRHGDQASYLAYDTLKNRAVMLRELPYDPYQRPEELERNRAELLREAKLTLELQHPAIARVEQLIPQDDCYYVVGEWIDGAQSLREVLAQGSIPVEAALDMAIACADALAYAHGRGVVHRDVRPENILLAGRTIKLNGFKMAKKADMATRSTFDLRQMVQENPYAAPEFRLGAEGPHRVDGRADIYALGAVLYEALTGKPPVHLDEKYWTSPTQVNAAVSMELSDLLQQALRIDPAQRFSTMAAFRERLLAVREGRPAKAKRYDERRLVKRTRNSLLFRANDKERSRNVALKKLLLDPMLGADARQSAIQRVFREAKIAGSLIHPRIVTVLDTFVEDDDPYVVMEWLEGHDLREHLDGKRPALSFEETLDVVTQVGEALLYAHTQGIVHRDIKPENILLTGSRATILDFGLATVLGEEPAGDDPARSTGTPRYMAPETLQGANGDARSDIYSLAVMFYELLTGRYPYGANQILGRFSAPSEGVRPPSSLNVSVPPAFDAPILQALSIAPLQRPETMEAFLSSLSAAKEEPLAASAGPQVSGKVLALAGGVSTLFVLGAIGLYLSGPGIFGRTQLTPVPASEASASISLIPEATPVPEATTAMIVPDSSPSPIVTPSPTLLPQVSWASAPVDLGHVVLQIEKVVSKSANEAILMLKVENQSESPISLLKGDSSALKVTDDRGEDYTSDIDWSSVSPDLALIEASQSLQTTIRLNRGIDAEAAQVKLEIKEDGGENREFVLRAYRLETK